VRAVAVEDDLGDLLDLLCRCSSCGVRAIGSGCPRTVEPWAEVLVAKKASGARESEFSHMLALASKVESVRAVAFGTKIGDIVRLMPEATETNRVIGRTKDPHMLFAWFSSMVAKFLPKAPKYDKASTVALGQFLKPRLGFLELEKYKLLSDAAKFAHLMEAKAEAEAMPSTLGGQVEGGKRPGGGYISSRLEQLHLSPRFETAVVAIREAMVPDEDGHVLDSQGVLRVVLEQAIPFLTQHMVGKRNLEGHAIYRDLGPHRCIWGTKGDALDRVGLMLGQILLSAHTAHDALAGLGSQLNTEYLEDYRVPRQVVAHFFGGTLEQINFESDLLIPVHAAVSGMTGIQVEDVTDEDRFMSIDFVDRMIDEVSPLFEAFGLGGLSDTNSFASVAQDAKLTLRALQGLHERDSHDLMRGQQFGLQQIVLDSLQCGSLTFKQLFQADDPLTVVTHGRLLQFGPMGFKHKLVGLHEALKSRRQEQRVFGHRAAANSTMEAEFAELKAEVASYKRRLDNVSDQPAPKKPQPALADKVDTAFKLLADLYGGPIGG
jgi:hypothetical protein